jgi:dTDP-glucose 4,6-dehydratase
VNILITGGAGFIGSNFIRYMVNKYKNYNLINLDALTYAGNPENVTDINENNNYSFIHGDITNKELVHSIFSSGSGIDYVVNFAAESHVDRSIDHPEIFIHSNIMGTQVLLEEARRFHVKKFLQISTDEVYGSLGDTGLFSEETPLSPNSPYSASKASADLFVRAYKETYGLPINITRCSNNYGPYQHPEKLIPLMISKALKYEPLPVYGDGLNIRDWLYVEDHCKAIDLVLHKGVPGEIYNVGGNNEKANIEIVKLILQELDRPESLIKYVQDRPGHDRRYGIDASKIRNELGWVPTTTFEQGIRETINWYLKNEHWINKFI